MAVVAETLGPKLLNGVAAYVVRIRPGLLLQLRRLRVSLRLQRNRVQSYGCIEFDIAIGVRTVAAVRVAGLTELGVGLKSGLCMELDMCTGLLWGVGMGIGMLGLLW